MCGIAGIISFEKKINEDIIYKMINLLEHRGPDDSGIYISEDKKVFFGNTRLSIIDLSENARQPITNENGNLWIIHNGEIYNYKELKNELLLKGHKFKSNSDTEVLLHLYEEEGENCLLKLNGIFSFAIWDEKEKKLFIARDRFGVKPIYYYFDKDFFIFSSEIKPIFENFDFVKKIDSEMIEAFLCFGSFPFPHTLFKGIKLLKPSCYLILKDKKIEIKKYYYINRKNLSKNYKELKENLYNILDESIKKNLVSDVPVGVFLSGGLDSSILVYFARKNNKNNLKTFSIIFDEKEFDEREFSRIMSKKFETQHFENLITSSSMKNEIERFLKFMDIPTIDGFNTYFVSKIARENGMKVCLSGIGGDEIFGGYTSFSEIPKILKLKNYNIFLKILSNFLREDKRDKLNYFISNPSIETAYFSIRALYTPFKIKKLLKYKEISFDPLIYINKIIQDEKFSEENLINKISLLELKIYMHNQILRDTDNFSMSNSLEVRVPLLEHKLVEFAFSIPSKYKLHKKILKDIMNDYLPEEIIKRKKKGFFFPMEKWLKGDLKDFLLAGIFDIDSFFDKKELQNLWKKFERGRIHWSRIWSISILNHYLKMNKLL
ncbi:MAG: asparagine synthase (glutamine-hydrolyzing) [candidate division WOR-3 bacterium]